MVSIIIRTKNEEKWISSCLKAVFRQTYKDFEVIIVDNNSSDKTVEKAQSFDVKIIDIDDFLPGKAINYGIRHSKGDIIVCLSGHCIPVDEGWLINLINNLDDPKIAGIYGKQEPMSFTSDLDKRDLMYIFGRDKKIQKKDPFFHNANSAIRREIWEKFQFDEKVTNIEDRVWGEKVLKEGYYIIYEPQSSVYHYHGIHQDGDLKRCKNVVEILESLELDENNSKKAILDINELEIVAIIPIIGEVKYCNDKPLLEHTIKQALQSSLIKKVFVSTDNSKLAEIAEQNGADAPFLRPESLSQEYVDLNMILQYTLIQLEDIKILPDLVVVLEVTYPFRPKGFIDELLIEVIKGGLDSVVPVLKEYRTVWLNKNDKTELVSQQVFIPRRLKKSLCYISLLGLGLVTYPYFIRNGSILGNKVGFLEVVDSYSHLEVRDEKSIELASRVIDEWLENNYK